MNITLYTHESFARYIVYCVIFGFLAFLVHCIIFVMISVPAICRCRNVSALKICAGDLSEGRSRNLLASDFLGALIIAISLLTVSFIANSGEFRIMSVPLLMFGFLLGATVFNKILIIVMSYFCFCVKKIVIWILSPIILLIRVILQMIIRIYFLSQKRIRTAQIAKYTKKKYKEFDIIKHTGLLDQLFEVV